MNRWICFFFSLILSVSLVQADCPCGPNCNCGPNNRSPENKSCKCGPGCDCPKTQPKRVANPPCPEPAIAYAPENDCCEQNTECCEDTRYNCDELYYMARECDQFLLNPCNASGVWFPEAPPLMVPFMADPRALQSSGGFRFNDDIIDNETLIDVSYADIIPLYRWFNIWGGEVELDIDGALWAIFEPFHYSSPLVDADYFIGGSLSYKRCNWTFRLRFYHISTHIGDEFLLDHPHFVRKNPSAEFADLFATYQLSNWTRLYTGVGYIPFSDESFPMKKWYFQLGGESYIPFLNFYSPCNFLLGRPFFGAQFAWNQYNNWNTDQTYVLGYEFAKVVGQKRKFRVFGEFHDGYNVDGQFCHERTTYWSVRISYGF